MAGHGAGFMAVLRTERIERFAPRPMTSPQGLRKIDPARIFGAAANFEYSAYLLLNENGRRFQIASAYLARGEAADGITLPTQDTGLVNLAFSLELYFKSLLLLESGRLQPGHSLYKLFHKISSAGQQRIAMLFEQTRETDPYWIRLTTQFPTTTHTYELEAVLKNLSNVYTNLRYFYEGKGLPIVLFGIAPLAVATRLAIVEINPAWENWVEPAMRTPPTSHSH